VILAEKIDGLSRAYAARLIKDGKVHVGGQQQKPSYKVKTGDFLTIFIPPPKLPDILPEDIPLNILFEDDQIIVINKPAGLVVHPAPGYPTGTLVHGLLSYCKDLKEFNGVLRPGIVHRLDKDTTGVLVVAKTSDAHENLSHQFKSRLVKKEYLSLVWGKMDMSSGTISFPIGRHPVDRKKMSTVTKKGRYAETWWQVVRQYALCTLIRLKIKTGRTHQIRVHCSKIGHPVLGDPLYGKKKRHAAQKKIGIIPRQMLHAWKIQISHPVHGNSMQFEAPLPEDMDSLIDKLNREQ
jgi:23S rRNA pseudouridine1911/1915/1917 synthase